MMRKSYLVIILALAIAAILYSDDGTSTSEKPDSTIIDSTAAIENHILPKMVDLGAKTCKACKKMIPIMDSLEVAYKNKAEIVFIDVRKDKKSLREYGVTLIPTQIFFDTKGEAIYRHIGFFSADSIEYHLKLAGMK